MKNIISKNILNAAKIAGKRDGRTDFVTIYPDGRIMATDSFKLIEIREGLTEESETLKGLFPQNEIFELNKPITISSKHLLEKQKFNKFRHFTDLEKVIITKGDDDEHVKFCSTDLESSVETIYRINKTETIPYEPLFPENPKYIASFTIHLLTELLNEMQKMGIREVDMLREDGSKPVIFQGPGVRAIMMPTMDEGESAIERYKESLKI